MKPMMMVMQTKNMFKVPDGSCTNGSEIEQVDSDFTPKLLKKGICKNRLEDSRHYLPMIST
jgi:hypothetical protein